MPSFNKNILIENIKHLMKENDVTQPKLAEDLHIGQPSISKCLSGKQSISIDLAYSLAQYFGVSLDELCRDPNESAPNVTTDSSPFSTAKEKYIRVCEGLATVFKNANLLTKEIEVQETVYEEEISPEGVETGYFSRQKGIFGSGDPYNKYTVMYFPNYFEIQTQFGTYSEANEYQLELETAGNCLEWNLKINRFLSKLAVLNNARRDGSMTAESYDYAIDSNIQELRK